MQYVIVETLTNRQEINRLNDKIISQNEEIEKLSGEIVTLKGQLAQASSNMSTEARTTISRLEGEVSRLRDSINGLERDLKYSQSQLAVYQRQNNQVPLATRTPSVEPSNIAGVKTNDVRIEDQNPEKEVTTDITQTGNNGASTADVMPEQSQTEETNKTDGATEKPKNFIQRIFSWKK